MPLSRSRKGATPARSKPKTADPKRTKLRLIAHRRAEMMHAMLGAIGPHPIYSNRPERVGYTGGAARGSTADKLWGKVAKAWLDANQKRYLVA